MSSHNFPEKTKISSIWFALLMLALGAVLIFGAIRAAIEGQWPVFMPMQLDLLGLLFKTLGNPLGGYVTAVFLFTLGSGVVWLGVVMLRRMPKA